MGRVSLSFATVAVAGTGAVAVYYFYNHMYSAHKRKKEPPAAEVSSLFIYPIKSCKGISVQSAKISLTGFLWDRWWMVVGADGKFITQRQEPKLALIQPKIEDSFILTDPRKLPKNAVMTLAAPGMDPLLVPLSLPSEGEIIQTKVWGWEGSGLDTGTETAAWFSKYLNRGAKLLRFDTERVTRNTDPKYASNSCAAFSDEYPYLVLSKASLDELNGKLEVPLPINRFRPNIFVDNCKPFAEDTWKTFTIGSETRRVFRGVKPCSRCKITTTDQETAEVGNEPLQTLKEFRSGQQLSLPKEFQKDVIFGMNVVCEFKSSFIKPVTQIVNVGDRVDVIDRADSISTLTPA